MSPTRRDYLRIGGLVTTGAFAGCLSSATTADDGAGNDGTTTGTETTGSLDPNGDEGDPAGGTRPAGTGGPGVTLASVDDVPDLPLVPSVEVAEAVATEEHPPGLRVTLTNEGDEPIRVGEGRAVVFEYVTADDGVLILLPPDGDYAAEAGCWRLKEPIATTMEYRILSFAPGESLTRRVDLYGTPGEDACLPVGEHRFESQYRVVSGDENVTDDGETVTSDATTEASETATWGFSVLLE